MYQCRGVLLYMCRKRKDETMTETEFKPSKYQQDFFDWIKTGTGSCILDAVAGSGKTTSLVQGLKYMPRGDDKLLLAFNKTIATELQEKTRGIAGVNAATVHSYGFAQYRKYAKRVTVDGDKMWKILDNYLERAIPEPMERRLWKSKNASHVLTLVAHAKSYCIGVICELDDEIAWTNLVDHFDMEEDLPSNWFTVCQWLLKKSIAVEDIINYDDMIYMPLYVNVACDQYDWVLLDEAQDTNSSRRLLAERALRKNGRLVAVGDPYQAIYGFTGASHDAIDQIQNRFKAVSLPLSVCYRCAELIVAEAQELVPHIQSFEGADKGKVKYCEYEQMLEKVKPGEAILCRNNAPLVKATYALIAAKRPAKMIGRDIGGGLAKLATKWKINQLDDYKAKLHSWSSDQIQKAIDEDRGAVASRIEDQRNTMDVFLEHCGEEDITTTKGLAQYIRNFFAEKETPNCIYLSSVHKAKGAEWETVWLLGRDAYMPAVYATLDWEKEQEDNLIYVAITRAMKRLIYVEAEKKNDDN